MLPEEVSGLLQGEREVGATDPHQLAPQLVAVQRQGPVVPGEQHQAEHRRGGVQDEVDVFPDLPVTEHVELVQDEHHRSGPPGQPVGDPGEQRARDALCEEWVSDVLEFHAGPPKALDDVGPEDPGLVVEGVERDPGDRSGRPARGDPRRQEEGLARTRSTADHGQRPLDAV